MLVSPLSAPDAKYLIVCVKNFYLNNPIKKNKDYKISINLIPQEVIDKYDLKKSKLTTTYMSE